MWKMYLIDIIAIPIMHTCRLVCVSVYVLDKTAAI